MWLYPVESLNIPAWRPHKIRYTDFRVYTAQSFFSFQTKSDLVSRPLFVNSWREVQEYVLPCSLAIFWKHIGPFRDVFCVWILLIRHKMFLVFYCLCRQTRRCVVKLHSGFGQCPYLHQNRRSHPHYNSKTTHL